MGAGPLTSRVFTKLLTLLVLLLVLHTVVMEFVFRRLVEHSAGVDLHLLVSAPSRDDGGSETRRPIPKARGLRRTRTVFLRPVSAALDVSRMTEIDTTDCENEPIEFPGAAMPHGALLVLSAGAGRSRRSSESCCGHARRVSRSTARPNLSKTSGRERRRRSPATAILWRADRSAPCRSRSGAHGSRSPKMRPARFWSISNPRARPGPRTRTSSTHCGAASTALRNLDDVRRSPRPRLN